MNTVQLHTHAQTLLDAARLPTIEQYFERAADEIDRRLKGIGKTPLPPIYKEFLMVAWKLYLREGFDALTSPPTFANQIEEARYRDHIKIKIRKLEKAEELIAKLIEAIGELVCHFVLKLPAIALMRKLPQDGAPATTVRLRDVLDVPEVIDSLRCFFYTDEPNLFVWMRSVLDHNKREASDALYDEKKRLLDPQEFKGTGDAAIRAYLKDTPIENIFDVQIPFDIPQATRFEHTHIVGGSGAGKTTLIQQMVLDDLDKPNPPAMVIIDPKGLLVERIQKLDVFDPAGGRLKDRLVIIDPTHTGPPALNMFYTKGRGYEEALARQIEAQAISNFSYIFSSVGSKLTDKQSVPFTFLVRLLFTVRDATILTFLELLDDSAESLQQSRFAAQINRLDHITRGFFQNEYFDRTFANSRKEIKARLYSVLMRPPLVDMFAAPERKLDMFNCLQSRKIVLVNTAMNALGRESSALLGRYMIALTLNAAFERMSVPQSEWNPAYLIVDEFQEFSDEQKTPELLRLAREYNLGVVIAHQQMHAAEFSNDLRNAISTNTSIKYAAAVEAMDQGYVARDLRCEPSFLTAQRRSSTHSHFACFVRNFTDRAVSIAVPLGNIQAEPQMSEEAHRRLLTANAALLSSPRQDSKLGSNPPQPRALTTTAPPSVADHHPDHGDAGEPASKW